LERLEQCHQIARNIAEAVQADATPEERCRRHGAAVNPGAVAMHPRVPIASATQAHQHQHQCSFGDRAAHRTAPIRNEQTAFDMLAPKKPAH